MRACQKCQRIVKRENGSNIETYRCINRLAATFKQTVTENICRHCDSLVIVKKSPKQKKTSQSIMQDIFTSTENTSKTSKEMPKKERCC